MRILWSFAFRSSIYTNTYARTKLNTLHLQFNAMSQLIGGGSPTQTLKDVRWISEDYPAVATAKTADRGWTVSDRKIHLDRSTSLPRRGEALSKVEVSYWLFNTLRTNARRHDRLEGAVTMGVVMLKV